MRLVSSGEKRPNWISLMVRKGALEKGKKTFDIVAVAVEGAKMTGRGMDLAGPVALARTWGKREM
jgi:hypothetical protein